MTNMLASVVAAKAVGTGDDAETASSGSKDPKNACQRAANHSFMGLGQTQAGAG
jgi:hypothetical protein